MHGRKHCRSRSPDYPGNPTTSSAFAKYFGVAMAGWGCFGGNCPGRVGAWALSRAVANISGVGRGGVSWGNFPGRSGRAGTLPRIRESFLGRGDGLLMEISPGRVDTLPRSHAIFLGLGVGVGFGGKLSWASGRAGTLPRSHEIFWGFGGLGKNPPTWAIARVGIPPKHFRGRVCGFGGHIP